MSLLAPGTRLGPYEVGEVLGRGGMGVVYKGYDATLDRVVALKVLPADFLHDATFADRLRREAQLWSRLDHPSIVPVFYSGVEGDHPFLAMKFLSGGPLSARIRLGPIPVEQGLAILRPIASALDYAHAAGIVHRDVKPANVLLTEDGGAYLTDFGIARALAESRGATGGSGIVGTPGYMAPEQSRSPRPDPRSDVYSLGCLAYEMLTGRPPFQGDTPVDVMLQHILEVPTPPRSWVPGLPESMEKAVLKAMAKDPAQRWPQAGVFVQALEGGAHPGRDTVSLSNLVPLREHPPATPSARRLALVALVSALVGFGGVALIRARIAAVASEAPAVRAQRLLGESNSAMDRGDYRRALELAIDATGLSDRPEVQAQPDRVMSAWEAEKSLGTWAPSPATPSGSQQPSPVDDRKDRR
jgi:serine/threonine protein kinase